MNTKDQILAQIKQVDEKLSILKESWADSKPEKRTSWMIKINQVLDERLELMKMRDAI
jgi:hypothetical protein